MTKGQTLENLAPLYQPPDEPDFDDELTVLQARAVVPLKQFDERPQRKRKWFLFGMFALAMFLGAASGLTLAYFKLREVSEVQLGVPTLGASEEPIPLTVSEEPDTKNDFGNLLPGRPPFVEQQLKLFTPKRTVIRPRRVTTNTKPSVPLPALSEEEE